MIDVQGDIQSLLRASGYAGSVGISVLGTNVNVSASQGDTTVVQSASNVSSSPNSRASASFLDISPAGQIVSRLQVALALIVPSTGSNSEKHSGDSEANQQNENTDGSSDITVSKNQNPSIVNGDLVGTVQSIVQNFIQQQISDPGASVHSELDVLPGGAENWMASLVGTNIDEKNITITEFGNQYYENAQQMVSSFTKAYKSGDYTVQSDYQMPGLDYNYTDQFTTTNASGTGFDPNAAFVNWAQQQDVANGTYSALIGSAYVTWANPNAAAQAASGFNLFA
jgi:hypothetical protein